MTDDAATEPGSHRRPLPRRFFLNATLIAGCAAMLAVWVFVVRPAQREAAPLSPGELTNSAGLDRQSDAHGAVGTQVPKITVTGFDGAGIALTSRRGHRLVINFWASTCASCVKEMPLLERAHRRHGDDVTFLGIDVFESEALGAAMIERTGVTYLQGRDPASELISRFGGTQLPHTVFVAADGTITALHDRALRSDAEIDALIEASR